MTEPYVGLVDKQYNFKRIEEGVLKWWKEQKIYEKVKELGKKSDLKFYFLDGPPYVTNPPHVAHL